MLSLSSHTGERFVSASSNIKDTAMSYLCVHADHALCSALTNSVIKRDV